MLGRVAEQDLVDRGGATFAPALELLEEDGEPLRTFRMMSRGVKPRERGVRQDVDRTISASSSSDATPLRARPTR